jgi:hypothetical protein
MERHPVDEMFERIVRRAMPDDEDGAGVDVLPCLTQPGGDPVHDLLIAFTIRERIHEMPPPSVLDHRRWVSRQIAVIALPKPGVTDDRNCAIAERDLGGAERP